MRPGSTFNWTQIWLEFTLVSKPSVYGCSVSDIDCSFNLAGHVRHQGLPVAGVRVLLYDIFSTPGEPLKETSTGSRGDFSFSVRAGVYRLDFEPAASTRFLKQTVEEVKATGNVNLNLGLQTGCIVSGLLKGLGAELPEQSANGDRLAPKIEVMALGIEPSSYRGVAAVGEDNSFSLVLPRGKYHLALRDCSEADYDGPHFICSETEVIDVAADADIVLVWPQLQPFSSEINDQFGAAVSGALVKVNVALSSGNLLFSEFDLSAQLYSDSRGQLNLLLSPGAYDFKIDPPATSLLFGLSETGLSNAESHKFVLAEGHRLRGQVFFKDQVLSQSLVRIQRTDKKQEYMARTDGDGNFSVALPGGSYKIIVTAHPKDAPALIIDGAEYSSLAPWTRTVIVGGDTHVAVRLGEGTALKGRVCDDSGQARPGVRVSVFVDHGEPPDAEQAALSYGITDGEGRYCLFLAPGSYWLMVHKDLASARLVELDAEPREEDIVWHGWTQIKFEVVGEDNQPVPRCQVTYHPYGQDDDAAQSQGALNLPYGFVLTGEGGACKLTLPSGVYTFRFTPLQDGSYQGKVIRQLSISADITRKVTLELKGKPS